MCHQSVGLIQSIFEREGMSTVSLSMLREITQKVEPPRVLEVPFPLGFPLGQPHDLQGQERILRQSLLLLSQEKEQSLDALNTHTLWRTYVPCIGLRDGEKPIK
jgi:hypothetical protein